MAGAAESAFAQAVAFGSWLMMLVMACQLIQSDEPNRCEWHELKENELQLDRESALKTDHVRIGDDAEA